MRVFDDHPTRNLGDVAKAVFVARHRFDRDQVAGLDLPHRAARIACGHPPGLAIGEAQSRLVALFAEHRGDPPIRVVDADIREGETALPAIIGFDRPQIARPGTARIEAQQPGAQCVGRSRLHRGVIGRADPKTTGIDTQGAVLGILAEFVEQFAPDLFHVIAAGILERRAAFGDQAKRQGAGSRARGSGDPAVPLHLAED